jgi:hypothetical protein
MMRSLRKLLRRNKKSSSHVQFDSGYEPFPRVFISDAEPSDADSASAAFEEGDTRRLLYSLGQHWAWTAITFQCQQILDNPDAHDDDVESLRHIDPTTGDTILHTVVIGKPPREAVLGLLQLCPELARVKNRAGYLPLHIACSYRVSANVLRCLLDAYPDAAAEPTPQGSYPLHILCDYGCEPDSILAILEREEGIKTIHLEDRTFQRTPLCLLNERKNLHRFAKLNKQLRVERELDANLLTSLGLMEAVEDAREDEFWRKACWLVLAEYMSRPLDSTDMDNVASVLHAFVCSSTNYCPSSLSECAVLVYADQIMIREARGRVALHHAAAHGKGALLEQLLDINPSAASIRDNDNQTSLQVAIATKAEKRLLSLDHSLLPLILASPAALHDLQNWSSQLQVKVLARIPSSNIDALFRTIKATHAMLSEVHEQ